MKEQIKAVDIVLLPPKEIRDFSIDFSRKLEGSSFKLDEEEFVPHITLNMGHTKDVEGVKTQIKHALKNEYPVKVEVDHLQTSMGTSIILRRSGPLLSLHFRMLGEVGLENYGRRSDAYYGGDARQFTLDYLSTFRSTHSRHRYVPHITIGDGKLPDGLDIELPRAFEADTVALFHLGNHNTCRELLGKWRLGE